MRLCEVYINCGKWDGNMCKKAFIGYLSLLSLSYSAVCLSPILDYYRFIVLTGIYCSSFLELYMQSSVCLIIKWIKDECIQDEWIKDECIQDEWMKDEWVKDEWIKDEWIQDEWIQDEWIKDEWMKDEWMQDEWMQDEWVQDEWIQDEWI